MHSLYRIVYAHASLEHAKRPKPFLTSSVEALTARAHALSVHTKELSFACNVKLPSSLAFADEGAAEDEFEKIEVVAE